jgi:hypothetical protein
MAKLDIYAEFSAWVDAIFDQPVPANVLAFSFNLYEGTDSFDLQITGAPEFRPSDTAWAGTVIYTTGENLFLIPRDLVSNRWETALELVLDHVARYITSGRNALTLRRSDGVGVGFVDGDLHHVWPASAA